MSPDIESVENRWDILYRDYPEVYEAFGRVPKTPSWHEVLAERFNLRDKVIADVGAGTGLSAFQLSPFAREVIGVEPEDAMRDIAVAETAQRGLANVRFVAGTSQAIPLADDSVDVVTAITLASLYYAEDVAAFVREAERVVRPGGVAVSVNIAPRWYGGDLAEIIADKPRNQMPAQNTRDVVFEEKGWAYFDYFALQDYGTTEHIVATYGFIFGSRVIVHLRETGQTRIKWKIRCHYKVAG